MQIFKKISIINLILSITLISIYPLGYAANTTPHASLVNPAAQAALTRLMDGNKRYISGKSTCGWTANPTDAERRKQLANTQKPFAVILGCSDSRVPPEIIFDQRLGDLFVIRVAGNIIDDVVLGSVEYAARFLGQPTPLVFVLGHEGCGAVIAAIRASENKGDMPNHIFNIIDRIMPVVLQTKKTTKITDEKFVDDVITANIQSVVKQLKNSTPILIDAVRKNELHIVGGRYNLDNGEIKIVG